MKNKINNINKDLIKRKFYIKNEIKKIILMSIIQNLNLKPIYRSLARKRLMKFERISFISKQNNNICLKSGRIKGVYNVVNLSRHEIKKFSTTGCLKNIKIKSW